MGLGAWGVPPQLHISADLPHSVGVAPDLIALPSRPGVFVLEDADGRTIVISATADLRRQVRARLSAPSGGPSRRPDYRAIARTVRATTVGSAFEADWVYLELARARLPHTYASLFDRWRGWFVHCDPAASFPRLVRTSTPQIGARGDAGVHVGPFADRHDAQRVVDALENGFDLCRYHHLLLETPHATACAYKEMGRCPAPCDGSIGMDVYRDMVRDAIAFAADASSGRATIERDMRAASDALDFERAGRLRQRLEALALLDRPAFGLADRLDRFRFVAVLPAEDAERVRFMTISGGRIEPWADARFDVVEQNAGPILDELDACMTERPPDLSPEGIETIGLVCWHLFRPAKARGRAQLVPARDGIDRERVVNAVRSLRRGNAAFEREMESEQP